MSFRQPPHFLARKVIGPYEYFESKVIGRGSHSIVYQGRKVSSGEKVCIKHVIAKSAVIQKLAKNEIEALKKINHANNLKLIASFERGSSFFIITELCETNLWNKIKKERRIDEQQALGMFLQLLEGYQHLRNRGYIHRDIKPENILIKDSVIKLGYYGYSTLLTSEKMIEPYNLGTPLYMAPQSLNHSIYSQKSDIWSLGVTFFQLLAGFAPFISKSEEQLKKELKRPIRHLDWSECINRIISKCLSYDSQDRCDLQRLLLEVKLAISQLKQKSIIFPEECSKQAKINQNQLNYIRFLEYILLLGNRTRNISREVSSRINFLFEYTIRVRLHLIRSLFKEGSHENVSLQASEAYEKCCEEHRFQLSKPEYLLPSDRLHFFKTDSFSFDKSLQWQTQAELKGLIKRILETIPRVTTEYQAAISEHKIKLVDFLISAFLLNKILIETENDSQKFQRLSHLEVILSRPCRINSSVLGNIIEKARSLRIA